MHFYQPLLRLSVRMRLFVLLLLEALIFLLDIDTGASISFAPFLCVPVLLSAWLLERRTTVAFITLSSVARVYDFHVFRSPNEAWPMLLYELLQSALLFSVVAALVLHLRGVTERLALHARQLRRSARQQHHRHIMEARIRRAVPDDIDAIVRLTAQGAQRGSFDDDIGGEARMAALGVSFRQGIIEGVALRNVWEGGTSAVPIEFWVSSLDGKVAGFLMILGLNGQKGAERELHAMVIDENCRGLGIGAALTNFFCAHYQQRRLFAACKPGTLMMNMLQRRGFRLHATTSSEFEVMVRD